MEPESIHPRHRSEVANLMEKIEAEHKAMCWALTGLSTGTAQHRFISRRFQAIDAHHQRLNVLVGEQASIAMIATVMENSPEQKGETYE